MRLSQTELDRVLVFNIAEMARRRRGRGLLLNYPEAVALITDEMMERAREGQSYEQVRAIGLRTLSHADVLPGVPALVRGLVCEPMFDDGPRVIILADPIPHPEAAEEPGKTLLAEEPITINRDRAAITVTVTNTSHKVVTISSHYHFFEVNPRMKFDRKQTYGHHLDIQAGRSVIWHAGETKTVKLVPFAGSQVIDGFQLRSTQEEG